MSAGFVIDASMGFAWAHPAQATEESDRLLDQIAEDAVVVVPGLWFLEVANGLLVAERRRKLTPAERRSAMEKLFDLHLSVDEVGELAATRTATELAERHTLSVYDACYLEVALRHKLPLATRDGALREAARKSGVKVLG